MEERRRNIEEIIVAFLTNDITEEELTYLDKWKILSPKNQERLDEFVSAWEKSEQLSVFSNINVDEDWNCVSDKIKQLSKTDKPTALFIPLRRIAAILIPVLFLSVSGLVYWNVPGFGRLSAFETKSKINHIVLPDGSRVTLNKNSRIVYPNNIAAVKERNIKLKGEAFFEVNHNKTPFKVDVKKALIEVLGTEFNVEANKSDIYVSVISGVVSVKANNNLVELTQGERATVHQEQIIEEQAETGNDIFWCKRQLKFKQASLAAICKELQKNFSEIKVVKFNTKDQSTKLTTTFNNQSLNDIIEELEIHFKKKITFDGVTLTVSD